MNKRGRAFDDSPDFFKVFLPSKNSQELEIPKSFVREFDGIIHKKTTLEGRDGRLWNVKVERTDGGVFMKNGWLEFVNHYSLRDGEFLVFKYTKNSTFIVTIFGTNGCKKTHGTCRSDVKVEELEEIQVKKLWTKPSPSKQSRGPKKSQKVASRLVRQEMSEIEELAVPENPYFIASINKKDKYNMTIPRELFSIHKVKVEREMVLRNEEGEEWPVKINKSADRRTMIGSGWLQFKKENDVQSCDTCKFTFLKGGSSQVIQVQILRGLNRG